MISATTLSIPYTKEQKTSAHRRPIPSSYNPFSGHSQITICQNLVISAFSYSRTERGTGQGKGHSRPQSRLALLTVGD